MESTRTDISTNDVNGSSSQEDAVAPGRSGYVRQVVSDRHQVTVGGSAGHAQQVSGSRYYATARTDCRIRIATWNVNTPYQARKFDNLKREAERMKLDMVGVGEVRWTGSGHVNSEGWTFYYSGGNRHEPGVGVLLKRELAESVLGCWQVSKRVMVMKIAAKPVGLHIIQVCASTTSYRDSEIDDFTRK